MGRTNSMRLNCVIKEGMRLKPVTAIGSVRGITHDYVVHADERNGLKDDVLIPSGAAIFCSQILLHRNPRYHDDPDEFKPSRWINPSEDVLNSLMTFFFGEEELCRTIPCQVGACGCSVEALFRLCF